MALFATRKIDELGRIVIPKELRKKYQIDTGTAVDICADTNGQIVLRKSEPFVSSAVGPTAYLKWQGRILLFAATAKAISCLRFKSKAQMFHVKHSRRPNEYPG